MRSQQLSALICIFCLFTASTLFAQDGKISIQILGSSAPKLQARLNYEKSFPFLQTASPLRSDSNIKFKASGRISPVSLNATADLVVTPLAFLELSAGGQFGLPWSLSLPLLGDLDGIVVSREAGIQAAEGDSLEGVYCLGRVGGALQFDLAALVPGEWNHVVLRAYQELQAKGYSGADTEDLWDYQSSGGWTNGLHLYGSYFLGYRMPLALDMVGCMWETETLDIDSDAVPDTYSVLSLVLNFSLGDHFQAALLPQITDKKVDEKLHTNSREGFFFKHLAFQFTWLL